MAVGQVIFSLDTTSRNLPRVTAEALTVRGGFKTRPDENPVAEHVRRANLLI